MYYAIRTSTWLIVISTLFLFGPGSAQALEAGAHAVRLLIPEQTPLGGDATRQGRAALGEHDPIWARCLFLDDGENAVYLLTLDVHHIPHALREQGVDLAAELTDAHSIFITATHTLNGPGGMESSLLRRWSHGRFSPEFLEEVAFASLDAMQGAREAKQRATLGYGTTRQQVLSENANTTSGPIDEQIGVIRVDNADGQALAIIANFSAMPRMVPDTEHYMFSADYPGAYYKSLEELSDPGCVALFFPGACGGQRPVSPENETGWAAVESVGRLLAVRTKEVANKMSFRDATLTPYYTEALLPPTVATASLPQSVVLQALKIDDLLLVFVPGVPGVEVGLALRQQTSALGLGTTFTVGVSNDYIGDIVPRSAYASGSPGAQRHYYGPGLASWLFKHVEALITGTDAVEESLIASEPKLTREGDLLVGTFAGDGSQQGIDFGTYAGNDLRARYDKMVLQAIQDGTLRPSGNSWQFWPPFLDPSPLALPALSAMARPWMQGMDEDVFALLEGVSRGAGLPLDAFWLLQHAETMDVGQQGAAWFQDPIGTQIAITGDRAGTEGPLLGVNLDWPSENELLVRIEKPNEGHAFVHVGFLWQLGVYVGMNDVGVSVALSEQVPLSDGGPATRPLEFLLREVLRQTDTFASALAYLRERSERCRGRVLLAGRDGEGWRVAMISFGTTLERRDPENDILLGVHTVQDGGAGSTRARYQLVESTLASERIVGMKELQNILTTGNTQEQNRHAVWNDETRYSVVLLPEKGQIHVAKPDLLGNVGPYQEFTPGRGATNE